jgi:hypothetical protein
MSVATDRLSLWRNRRFALLASARVISVLGNGFARVALAFAVLALPGRIPPTHLFRTRVGCRAPASPRACGSGVCARFWFRGHEVAVPFLLWP